MLIGILTKKIGDEKITNYTDGQTDSWNYRVVLLLQGTFDCLG